MGKARAVKIVREIVDGTRHSGSKREFQALRRYESVSHSHPGLLPVLSVGTDAERGYFYYSMELADDALTGEPLAADDAVRFEEAAETYLPSTLRQALHTCGRFEISRCVEIASQLAEALECLHRGQLIHRDIKPENIIFVHGRPKLADIGLIAAVDGTYSLAGTEAYLSPEVPRGKAADIFALGKVLYEMASGRPVQDFPDAPQDLGAWPQTERSAFNELNEIILRACAANVAERYSSAEKLREELDLFSRGASIRKVREIESRDLRLRRAVKVLGGVAAVLFVLLVFSALAAYGWRTKRRAEEAERRRGLRDLAIEQMTPRVDGWFAQQWNSLKRDRAEQQDLDTRALASSMLEGLDAFPVAVLTNRSSSSASFGPTGSLLFAGGEAPILLSPEGTEAPVRSTGRGVTGFNEAGDPLLLSAGPGGLRLVRCTDNEILRRYESNWLENPEQSAPVLALGSNYVAAASIANPPRLLLWSGTNEQAAAEIQLSASALAFSPDGALLAAGDWDGNIHLIDCGSAKEIAVLPPPKRANPIACIAFGRDPVVRYSETVPIKQWLLATGDRGAEIVVWDLKRRLARAFLRGSTWMVGGLAFSPDGALLASVGRNLPRIWDVARSQILLELSRTSAGESSAVAFDYSGKHLATGGTAGPGEAHSVLWRIERHRGIRELYGLSSPVRRVWISENGEFAAGLSDTWELGVWKVSEDRLLFIFETPKGLYADEGSGAFGPGGKSFVFTAGIEACRFDLCTGLLTAKWKLNPGWSREIQYDHEGRLILFSCEQRNEGKTGLWKLYELNDGSPPKALTLQRDQSWSAEGGALSPDGRIAIVWSEPRSGRPRTMRALAVENGSELWHAQTESLGGNVRVGFDPQGEHFSYSSMSTNMAWVLLRTADFHEIGRVSDIYQCIGPEAKLFAGNGLLLPDQSGWMHAIPLTLSRGKHLKYVYAFSGDGKRLACGTSEGVVLVVETEELTRRIAELSDPNMSAPPKGTCPD